MSKKMMKRSLALGALMAFVITGSAMAAEGEKLFDSNLNVNGSNLSYSSIGHSGAVTSTDSITTGGISSYSNFTVTAGTNVVVTTSSGTAIQTALDSPSAHILGIDFKGDLTVTATGDAHGIVANAPNSEIDIDGNGTGSVRIVAAENAVSLSRRDDYKGTKVEKNEINIHDVVNVYIESKGEDEASNDADRGHVIYSHNEDGKVVIDATGNITLKAVEGKNAVKTNNNASVELFTTGESIDVTGTVQGNFGIAAENGTLTVTTTGEEEAGLYAQSDEAYLKANTVGAQQNEVNVKNLVVNSGSMAVRAQGANLTVNADNVTLNSQDGGIYVGAYKNTGGVEVSEGAGSVIMNVSESLTIDAVGNGVSVASTGPSKNIGINCDGVVTINAGGNGVYTRGSNILAEGYTPNAINITGSQVTITSTGENEGNEVDKGHAVFASGSSINISATEKIELNAEFEGKNAIYANQGNGDANDGKVAIGSVEGSKADVIVNGNINAANEASIAVDFATVNSSLTGAVQTDDGANTSLNMDGATWNVTGNSNVTEITGAEANIKVGMVSEDAIATVNIKNELNEETAVNVSGSGAVSDYLAKNGAEAENAFANSVKANGQIVDEEITTEEGTIGGAYTLKIAEDGSVVANQAVNTKSDAVSDAGMALKGHWRAHMNDMNKRMGELRMANGEHGVWTRMVRGESEYQGAKMQYNQYQLGYDEKLSVDKRWTVGAAVTFSEGDSSYGFGSTDDKSTAFAIYGSKLNNDGTFVDLIARYAHLESDLDDRNYGTGDYSTNGMSVSAEFGKRIQQGNGLWIEPQVELTYGTVDSADVTFSKAYKAHYDSMDSFIARAGFALGKDIKQGNVYARASYLYDFDGETETQFEGGKAISEDFGGGWWEVGVGANINLSKATYIYADIEKTFGGEVDTNWQWNLGVRYSF